MQFWLCVFLWLSLSSMVVVAQSSESPDAKVCVAVVSNASAVSADLDRLTERLVKSLKRNKYDAVAMDSSTTMNHTLQPTRENKDEADDKQCKYTVLTQIVENRAHPAAAPTRRPGGPIVPDLDASATQPGPGSTPPYREEMQINFALFRERRVDPVADTSIFQQASASVSDTFMAAMDRVASRVSHEMKKK
jgi:hypothetical protein